MKLDIVGKALAEAASIIAEADMSFRIVMRDGKPFMKTADVRPGRVNLTLAEGKVTSYTIG